VDKNRKKDEHSREAAKLCFEFFKHFTTIATAVALVELALVQWQFELRSGQVVVGVVLSGITLLLSIVGMASLALRAAVINEVPETGVGTYLLILFTAAVFFTGIFMFVVAAFPEPTGCPFEPFC
jgi:hypothetical protein